MLHKIYLQAVWILMINKMQGILSDTICDKQCICDYGYLRNLRSLACTNTTIQAIENFINDLPRHRSYCQRLEIKNNTHISEINSHTFAGFKGRYLPELLLINNSIETLLGNPFIHFAGVTMIDLSHNEIKLLGDFQQLSQLRTLYLGFNMLGSLGGTIFRMPEDLKYLYLNNNRFRKISEDMFNGLNNMSLIYLDLSHNEIVAIDGFGRLNFLETLNLAFNKLQSINRTMLSKLQNVVGLDLSNNVLNFVEDFSFQIMKKLERLHLSNNQLQIIFQNWFKGLSNLKYFYLENNRLTTIESTSFSDLNNLLLLNIFGNSINILENNTFLGLNSLRTLQLSAIDIKTIQAGAFNGMVGLTSIDLSSNHLEILYAKTHLCSEGRRLTFSTKNMFFGVQNLENLKLNNNKINQIESKAFIGLKMLEIINLSHNNLSNIVADTFAQLHNLHTLNLTYNKISFLSSESFAGLTNLRLLLINENKIKEVAQDIFKNLRQLENLQLGRNYLSKFSSDSFSDLAELRYLNLSYNNFSTLDGDVLWPLRKLESLDLNKNNLSYINYTHLLLCLPKLHSINLSNNKWTCEFLIHLINILRGKGISYFSNESSRTYVEENVDGIFCTWIGNKFNIVKEFNINSVMPLFQNVSVVNDSSGISYSDNPNVRFFSLNTHIVLVIVTIFSFIINCALLAIIIYKQYFQKLQRENECAESSTEIQLINVST